MEENRCSYETINTIEYSDWECALFGGGFNGGGFVWVPNKGCVPNRFWRLMQFLVFGNEWRKKKEVNKK